MTQEKGTYEAILTIVGFRSSSEKHSKLSLVTRAAAVSTYADSPSIGPFRWLGKTPQ